MSALQAYTGQTGGTLNYLQLLQQLMMNNPSGAVSLAKMVAKQTPPPVDINTMADLFLQVRRVDTQCWPNALNVGSGGIRDNCQIPRGQLSKTASCLPAASLLQLSLTCSLPHEAPVYLRAKSEADVVQHAPYCCGSVVCFIALPGVTATADVIVA